MTMKTQIPHELTHAVDPDGKAVVGVGLSNRSKVAWLYLADYLRITAEYGTPVWAVSGNGGDRFYVRFRAPKGSERKLNVARLVAGDWEKTGVRYRDGDPLNLRSTNLAHEKGRGGCPNNHKVSLTGLLIPTGQEAVHG